MGAVSLAEAKAALSGYAGSSDDSAITAELAVAEAQVAELCGWPPSDGGARSFETGTWTVFGTRDPVDHRRLLLPVPPTTVTTVHVSDSGDYDSSSLVSSSYYTIANDDGGGAHSLYALDGQRWSLARRGNQVVMTAGWAEGSAPDTLRAAVLSQLIHRWKHLRTAQGVATATVRGNTIARDSLVAVPDLVAQAARLSPAWSGRSCG